MMCISVCLCPSSLCSIAAYIVLSSPLSSTTRMMIRTFVLRVSLSSSGILMMMCKTLTSISGRNDARASKCSNSSSLLRPAILVISSSPLCSCLVDTVPFRSSLCLPSRESFGGSSLAGPALSFSLLLVLGSVGSSFLFSFVGEPLASISIGTGLS
jgi:hypothetical protein